MLAAAVHPSFGSNLPESMAVGFYLCVSLVMEVHSSNRCVLVILIECEHRKCPILYSSLRPLDRPPILLLARSLHVALTCRTLHYACPLFSAPRQMRDQKYSSTPLRLGAFDVVFPVGLFSWRVYRLRSAAGYSLLLNTFSPSLAVLALVLREPIMLTLALLSFLLSSANAAIIPTAADQIGVNPVDVTETKTNWIGVDTAYLTQDPASYVGSIGPNTDMLTESAGTTKWIGVSPCASGFRSR